MSINLDTLSYMMEKLYNDVLMQDRILSLTDLRLEILTKGSIINSFCQKIKKKNLGRNSLKLLEELEHIETDFKSLYDNFDDNLMIFIIGNGNVGKSTLLNTLIGYEVADIDFLPNTWKIDVYSPELKKENAIIKYSNGKSDSVTLKKARDIVGEEEIKAKNSKKLYNKKLNEQMKKLKTKEERQEMKKYLGGKYLYKSNISEVRWFVEKNWILESCLLVDTPGLNQNLHDLDQMGNIYDYYHKADGVLWLLDGQTISAANANLLFQELDEQLEAVNGIRDNIIGVINRMDLVKQSGGEESVVKVCDDAREIFGNKFKKIVPISAEQAFRGIQDNNSLMIEESGILNLKTVIRDIFISKSDSVKNSAKIQGHNKLLDQTMKSLCVFNSEIEEFDEAYIEKSKKLNSSKIALKNSISQDVNNFFDSYLNSVKSRINRYIDELGEGKGVEFIEDTIYRLDDFEIKRDQFIKNKQLEIKNNIGIWKKNSRISEYKYIEDIDSVVNLNISSNFKLNLSSLSEIKIFTPSVASGSSFIDEVLTLLGNGIGKFMFNLRKDGIKSNLNKAISDECDSMEKNIVENLNNIIEDGALYCKEIIDVTFEDILFKHSELDFIKNSIKKLEEELNKEDEGIGFKDIIL